MNWYDSPRWSLQLYTYQGMFVFEWTYSWIYQSNTICCVTCTHIFVHQTCTACHNPIVIIGISYVPTKVTKEPSSLSSPQSWAVIVIWYEILHIPTNLPWQSPATDISLESQTFSQDHHTQPSPTTCLVDSHSSILPRLLSLSCFGDSGWIHHGFSNDITFSLVHLWHFLKGIKTLLMKEKQKQAKATNITSTKCSPTIPTQCSPRENHSIQPKDQSQGSSWRY